MSDRILFLIPARGGSARIPGKNLVEVAGIPLVGWAIRAARIAAAMLGGGPHLVVCSTDDAQIGRVARAWGATVLERPPRLATDLASSVDVALHAIDALGADAPFSSLALMQPTSPLTVPIDIVRAVERHQATSAPVVSVTETHPATWHVAVGPSGVLGADPGGRSSDDRLATRLLLSGAFYVIEPSELQRERRFSIPGRTLAHVVATDRSVDVDEPEDLEVARAMFAARPVRTVPVGAFSIGAGRPMVIAEAGVNHDGDVQVAHRLVDAAADIGADAVKFQTFDPDALVVAGAPKAAYQTVDDERWEDQREMLRRLALPPDAWSGLQARARDRGIEFLSTPFDDASADLLDRLDVPAFKVASGELTNLPFIARLARRGRPMLVSTGMSDMAEVAAAVDAVAASADPPLALLHCVSSYPAAPSDANLRAIATMRDAFAVPVGWSDHTEGTDTALGAVSLGAALVEKHLTLDRTRSGPDHRASMEPAPFAALILAIRTISDALGTGVKAAVASESDVADAARRSLHWRTSLPAGATITVDDLVAIRPGVGIPPRELAGLIGRRVARPTQAGQLVRHGDVLGFLTRAPR